jgi:predicted nuclease of predicted toxin-antitoxin system
VRLLLDENVEKALLLGLRRRHPGLDVVRVVDVGLGGRSDPEILEWAAREGRVVLSRDRATLSAEAARRIEGGKPMPGLILLRRGGWRRPDPRGPGAPPGYRAARGAGERHPVPASLSLEKTLGTQVRDLMGPPWEVWRLPDRLRHAGGLQDLGERGGLGLEVPGLRLLDRDLHAPVRFPQTRGLRALLRQRRLGDRRL